MNKETQIFDKQKFVGRLIKISFRNLIKSQPNRPNRELFQRSRTYLLNLSTNSSKVTSSWSPVFISFNGNDNSNELLLEWSSLRKRPQGSLSRWRTLCREQVWYDWIMSIRLVTRTYFLNLSTNSSKVTSTWSPECMFFKLYFLDFISSSPRTIT